jgi:hypothetical protein
MSRGQLTALIAALALGAFAPRLAAQDTAAAGRARPDTSGYSGAAGVDTSAQPGIVDSAGAPTAGRGADSVMTSSDSSSAGSMSDSASVARPSKQPGQSTSRTGDSASTTGP